MLLPFVQNNEYNKCFSFQNYVFTIVFNSTMVHSLPVLMNIISNLLLRALNITESIQVWSHPFVQVSQPKALHPGVRQLQQSCPKAMLE